MQPDLTSTNVPQRFISEYTHIFPIPNVTVHFLANYLLASKVLIEISLCDMLSQIYLNLIYGQPLEDHRKKKNIHFFAWVIHRWEIVYKWQEILPQF